ncbi:His-Xaa-Ser system radical SAM maturase HxsC [Stappia sp.]|uniref:His-Xaa-Ser system radical SAM maturase HxsC n=1 Tax=Stappia sp. TaxID=1870903 RepID=UPI003D0E169F
MIPLRLRTEPPPISQPMVVRLRSQKTDETFSPDDDAVLVDEHWGWLEYDVQGFSLRIEHNAGEDLDGDVILMLPGRSTAHRLVRARSPHNTFLVTERCDQLCLMCSQPPKKHHHDLFPQFKKAALLSPAGATIGISGGEPLLYKKELFDLLQTTLDHRADLRFHVLTNAQHFEDEDRFCLRDMAVRSILWGVPIYAPDASLHDEIVGKDGAFSQLLRSLSLMARFGLQIELRTVVTKMNIEKLPDLARFISTFLPYCSSWALMQLEPIGFARKNWETLFYDNSVDFGSIARAVDIAAARGIDVSLFNFPLCSVPDDYRRFASVTISDWKQRYLEICTDCRLRERCGGFFEWYDKSSGFSRLGG